MSLGIGSLLSFSGPPGSGSSSGGGSSSGVTKYAESFTGITSGIFNHGLGSMDVIIQVRDSSGGGARIILPDKIIIENLNQVSLVFNAPKSGRVVIL